MPLGGDEYRKWGPSAEARIVSFMIGSGVEAGKIDNTLYLLFIDEGVWIW